MEWITWYPKNDPEALDSEMKREYAQEVHRAFPALLGAMAATAALSMDVYRGLQPTLSKLYELEERVHSHCAASTLRGGSAPRPSAL